MKLLDSTNKLMKLIFVSLSIFSGFVIAETQVASSPLQQAEHTRIVLITARDAPSQVTLNYDAPVRLERVLQDSLQHIKALKNADGWYLSPSDIYWAGASLINMQKPLNKTDVAKRLDKVQAQWANQPSNTSAINALKHWIGANLNNARQLTTLDYDVVLLEPSLNPIVSGKFTLVLPPRPKHVLILGATAEPKFVEWQERQNANDYLNKTEVLEDADNSYVWVIQPDGVVEKHPIAYWNQNHMDIAPGATIYLGYSSFPSTSKDLNQEIVNLLKNRAL